MEPVSASSTSVDVAAANVAGGREDEWILRVGFWALSLIVLTIAIHTTAVVLLAFGLEARIRARVDKDTLTCGGRFPP